MKKINIPINPIVTNADWIRAMTDDELVAFIGHHSLCNRIQRDKWCDSHATCENCLEDWLKQPVEE